MEINKIKEKVEFLDVEAQGCFNDCVSYTDSPVRACGGSAIYVPCRYTKVRSAHKSTKY